MKSLHSWKVSPLIHARERRPILEASDTFDAVASRIAGSLHVLCCHLSQVRGTEFKRPVYTVQISEAFFDQFFNASCGYRAAYYRSPGAGINANHVFMKAVSGPLLEAHVTASIDMTTELVEQSLATPSAKAWLAEAGKEPERDCPTCRGEWSTGNCGPADVAEILNERWELTSGVKAEWGRKAPYLTKLRVMGAFLDECHNELVPYDKRFRAQEIHAFGWS